MPDVMQTIREAFKELISIVEIHSRNTGNNFAWAELPDAQQALTALDSLVGAPSEDAKAFAIEIAHKAFDPWFFNKIEKQYMGAFDHDVAAALIQAHDDAIRREERNRCEDIFCGLWPDKEAIRAAIIGAESGKEKNDEKL